MAVVLKVTDEFFGSASSTGTPSRRTAGELRLVSERVTPEDIIRRRIVDEVDAINRRTQVYADGLAGWRSFLIDIDPKAPDALLNKVLPRKPRPTPVDAETETRRAMTAFAKRAFIMLVDDRQIDEPDTYVTLGPESEVVFLYLTPLKGG